MTLTLPIVISSQSQCGNTTLHVSCPEHHHEITQQGPIRLTVNESPRRLLKQKAFI